jgi:protein deglycase
MTLLQYRGFEKAGFYKDAFKEKFLDLIRQFDTQGKIIASICVAALPIGKSGVLRNRFATTYDIDDLPVSRQKQLAAFGAIIKNERIVIDKNIITSTGPATALEVAFILLEMLTDNENVNLVKKFMRFKNESPIRRPSWKRTVSRRKVKMKSREDLC